MKSVVVLLALLSTLLYGIDRAESSEPQGFWFYIQACPTHPQICGIEVFCPGKRKVEIDGTQVSANCGPRHVSCELLSMDVLLNTLIIGCRGPFQAVLRDPIYRDGFENPL